MLKIGKKQSLYIVRMARPGAYLAEHMIGTKEEDTVLLPGAQVSKDAREGDKVSVFVYRDSKDRPVATVNEPFLTLGELARLKVVSVSNIGAFLDWGLEKDLFLPFKEQSYRVKEGDEVLCGLYLDKSNRLCATMKIYKYLKPAPENFFKEGDWVLGTVYELSSRHGAFVAVDDLYGGLIPLQEKTKNVVCGEKVSVRIIRVRNDGKLDLSLRDKAYKSIEEDVRILKEYKDAHNGDFPFNDKSDPEVIRETFGMSKNQFKRAYGHIKYN